MRPLKKITVLFAEDEEIFRAGFLRIIDHLNSNVFEIVAHAVNGIDLLEKVKRFHPDIVLTDIRMPVMDGVQACKLIKEKFPRIGVIAFSLYFDESYILEMINTGASGYVVKSGSMNEIIEAIQTVNEGHPYYCSTISHKILGVLENSNTKKRNMSKVQVTTQEIKIIKLICHQKTTKEIAHALNISVKTVEGHRQQIQQKIGARNVVGIALYAVVNNLIEYDELD